MANESQHLESSLPRDRYTMGYGMAADGMATRSATNQASFFLPHLKPGMSLLDCGCGPGTITVGLAEIVSPGQVVGIDVEESQIKQANANAASRHLTNVEFRPGSVYQLQPPDESFDAVLMHGVMEHLTDPMRALEEVFRVLKPGGIVGMRSIISGLDIIEPREELIYRQIEILSQISRRNGGDNRIGRRFSSLARDAGFSQILQSATFDCRSHQLTPDMMRIFKESGAEILEGQAIELGLTNLEEKEEIARGWKRWTEHPDAFMARAWGELVAWKE